MRRALHYRVTLHTIDGRSIEGVLTGVYNDVFVLAHAEYLMDDGHRETLAGEVLVPAANVAFVQAPLPADRQP